MKNVKARQEAFRFAPKKQEVRKMTEELIKEEDTGDVCAVSREALDGSQTYFMLASFNLTNVGFIQPAQRSGRTRRAKKP